MKKAQGFTIVELLVTLALVGIAASVVLPLMALTQTRAKEVELKRSLRVIRQALDDYKRASDNGLIDKKTDESGYPPNLMVLVEGVQRSASFGYSATPYILLRSLPRDPFNDDKTLPAEQTWNIRSYGAKQGAYGGSKDVFDVASKSTLTALDGSKYSEW